MPKKRKEEARDEEETKRKTKKVKKKSKLFIILVITLVCSLVVTSGVAAYFFFFQHEEEQQIGKVVTPYFYSLPSIMITLDETPPAYLKIKIALEVRSEEEIAQLETFSPQIIDQIQIYTRSLKKEDLRGFVSIYRLKEQILIRLNSIAPVKIHQVLFEEILMQ